MYYLVKGVPYFQVKELTTGLDSIFTDPKHKKVIVPFAQSLREISESLKADTLTRYPVILVLDEVRNK